MNFSIVLIARNESKTLPRLVGSLKEYQARGGEIVVLDTGSTDGTAEIAKNLGCKVTEVGDKFRIVINKETADSINSTYIVDGEEPIIKEGDTLFDFSSARNYAASLASNDMVTMPDCDEIYTSLNLDILNEKIASGIQQFEYQFVFSHDHIGKPLIQFLMSKFYNRKNMIWKGMIHEVLSGMARREYLEESVIKLEHYQNVETNRSGYLTGLAYDCYRDAKNDRNAHYFARELMYRGRFKSAIQMFNIHITLNGWLEERAQSMLHIGDCYSNLGDTDEMFKWYFKAMDICPDRREPFMKLAEHYFRKDSAKHVIAYAEAALTINGTSFYSNYKPYYTNLPHELLYWAYWWAGDKDKSKQHFDIAFRMQPNNPKYIADRQIAYPNEAVGYKDQGIDGWMTLPELNWLHDKAKNSNTILELGSWKGRSTHALLSANKAKITAVDTWKGSGVGDLTNTMAKEEDVYEVFKKNTEGFTNLTINRKTGVEAAKDYPDRSFDCIFIDAGHTYEEVKEDIAAWLPKAKKMICGHDYMPGWPGVIKAVDEAFGKPDGVCDTIWYKELSVVPKVSIIIPTLGRPEKLQRLLTKITENANYDNYEILVEEDHMPPNNLGVPTMVKNLVARSTGEFVMFLGNDCIPEKDFLKNAMLEMANSFHDMDGLVGLNDGYWHGEFATHWLASKELLPMLDGEFFHTGYFHCGCDNELTERCRKVGKYVWAENAVVYHDHPVQTGFQTKDMDDVYALAYDKTRMMHDQTLLNERSILLDFPLHNAFEAPRKRPVVIDSINLRKLLPANYENMRVLNVGIGAGTSMLAQQLPFLKFKKITHLDVYEPYITAAKKLIWDSPVEFIQKDVRSITDISSYDLVLMFDVLEHLPKEDSIALINRFTKAGIKVLAFTPVEKELMNHRDGTDDIESQMHYSLWDSKDFEDLSLRTVTLKDFHGLNYDAVWAMGYGTSIPRRIFSIWLNDKPIPKHIKKAIDSCKQEGFEHKLITLDNCYTGSKYVQDCLSRNDVKGWVKAADYLRLYYLYTEGGIYFDADTTIIKPLDNALLNTQLFSCRESNGFVANGIIGAVPKHPVIKICMDMMDTLNGKNSTVFENGMGIWTKQLDLYGHPWFIDNRGITRSLKDSETLTIYPMEYFLPYNHETGITNITNNTYTNHSYEKTWKEELTS